MLLAYREESGKIEIDFLALRGNFGRNAETPVEYF